MLKINFVTLFPNYFKTFKNESIVKRAIEKNKVKIKIIDFRDYSLHKNKKVDDEVYGGGQGMLLMIQPIHDAIKNLQGKKILLSPQGKIFNQKKAHELSQLKEITFISGHYEGYDERIRNFVDEEISIGDFVLTGGEIPAMALADAIIRLIPGVINNDSHINDSFEDGLLDYPQFTRPRNYEGFLIPDVLLNGDHKKIHQWREKQKVLITKQKRPDLYRKYKRSNNEK